MAIVLKEVPMLIWKSQTYFGQLYVCLWFLSYLATLIGTEILHSMDNYLICNSTVDQSNIRVMCPEYDSPRLKNRFTFMVVYGVLTFTTWFLYIIYAIPRLRNFHRRQESIPLCGVYAAYFVQLIAKFAVHTVMLFIYISHVHFSFPVRLHCNLQNATDANMKPKENISCTDKYRVEKSLMETTLLLVLALLAVFCLAEFVYILQMMRSRSKTVFVGDEGHRRREHLDNGCWCLCVIPTDRMFITFHLHVKRINSTNENETESEGALPKYFKEIKNFYLEKTEDVAGNFHSGDTEVLKLDDIFVQPDVTELKHPKSSTKSHFTEKKSESVPELSTFLVSGKAGMGKTMFAQKIVRQWAKGESWLSNQVKIVFFLDFNVMDGAKPTFCLEEIVRNQFPSDFSGECVNFVKGNPSTILIVVDNVSESSTEFQEADFVNDLEEQMPFAAMLKKLIAGKLLKGATILALSRLAHSSYTDLFRLESRTEIVGFSPETIKEYIKRYFGDAPQDELQLDTFVLVESLTDDSLSICCVPSHCYYMCRVLKWLLHSHNASILEKQDIIPETMTQLYTAMMQIIASMPKGSSFTPPNSLTELPLLQESSSEHLLCDDGSSNGAGTLNSQDRLAWTTHEVKPSTVTKGIPQAQADIHRTVCHLALRSIDEGKTIFSNDELSSLLPNEVIPIYFRPVDSQMCRELTRFSFRWGHLQEFLAASFIVSDLSLKRFGNLVEQIKDDTTCNRDQVLQFACGLLYQQSQVCDKMKNEVIRLVTELGNPSQPCKRRQKELQLVMMKCVAEVKDDKLSREVASKFLPAIEFPCYEVGVAECSALANVLRTSPFASIRRIDLSDNKIGVMGVRQLAQKLLLPCKGPTEELNVKGNALGDQGLEELAEAVGRKEYKLKILNVADNGITNAGVSKLSSTLDSNSSLEELNLSCNGVSCQGMAQLATVLRKEKTKISRLNLSWNNLGDDGVASLASARQSTINLAWNNITIKGIHSLVSIFQTLMNLQELDLSGNIIEAAGFEALLSCLTNPGCRMKCLTLNNCNLTDEGVIHCAKVLTFPPNQIACLGLAGNGITNGGVGELAQALGSLECKVKCLNLSSNFIGDEGVETFSLSLGSASCNLQELDLSKNEIQDEGCKFLAAAIRKRNCLTRLDLQGNQVGDEGAKQLLSALRIYNCRLHSLILDENDIGDEGISGLPHAFSSPHCKLENLQIRRNLISRNSLETLSEAMNRPFCHLEQLGCDSSRL